MNIRLSNWATRPSCSNRKLKDSSNLLKGNTKRSNKWWRCSTLGWPDMKMKLVNSLLSSKWTWTWWGSSLVNSSTQQRTVRRASRVARRSYKNNKTPSKGYLNSFPTLKIISIINLQRQLKTFPRLSQSAEIALWLQLQSPGRFKVSRSKPKKT